MAESSYASMADSLPYISRSSSDIGEYDSTKNLTSKTPTQSLSSQTSIRSNNSQLPSKSFSSSQSLSTHRPTSSLRPLTTIETPKRLKNKFTCSEGIYTLSSDIPRQPQSTSTGSSLSQRKSTTFPVDLFTTELNANHLHVLYYSLGYYTLEKYKSDGFVDKLASFRVKTPSICCDLHFDQNLGNLMIFGLNNGHILYYDIEHQISSSFNCLIERKPISLPSVVRWVPNNPQRFVAGFRDGTLQVFDVALSDSKFADLIRLGSDRPRCVRQSNSSSNPLVFWLISNRSISGLFDYFAFDWLID